MITYKKVVEYNKNSGAMACVLVNGDAIPKQLILWGWDPNDKRPVYADKKICRVRGKDNLSTFPIESCDSIARTAPNTPVSSSSILELDDGSDDEFKSECEEEEFTVYTDFFRDTKKKASPSVSPISSCPSSPSSGEALSLVGHFAHKKQDDKSSDQLVKTPTQHS